MTSTGNETQTAEARTGKRFFDDDDSSELSALEDDEVVDSEAETERLDDDQLDSSGRRRMDDIDSSPKKRKIHHTTVDGRAHEGANDGTKDNNKEESNGLRSSSSSSKRKRAATEAAAEDADQEEDDEDIKNEAETAQDDADNELEEDEQQTTPKPGTRARGNDINDKMRTTPPSAKEEPEKHRKEAIALLTEIEIDFAKLRDKLYEDKMTRFVAEIEMCMDGTHPELEKVSKQIENIRDEKISLAARQRDYQRKCIDNQTRASRDQLHQQYLKDVADARSRLLTKTTEQWYSINRERRAMDSRVPDFTYRAPEKRSVQLRHRQMIHDEISLLMGLAKRFGFPTAPQMSTMQDEEIESDLYALGLRQ